MKVGIVGLGNFGRFVAGLLVRDKQFDIVACSTREAAVPQGVTKVDLEEVALADVIVLCIPLSAYGEVLSKLRPLLKPESLVVDVCSVKVEAEKRLRQLLPDHQSLLCTHPMFGPQSAVKGTAGHTLVVTRAAGERAQKLVDYCQQILKLKIERMTSEEHDQAMADVHALTFFVARGLTKLGLRESPLQAPSFQMLLDLIAFDKSHTDELFRTVEIGNPYAKSARERFVKTLQSINDDLEEDKL